MKEQIIQFSTKAIRKVVEKMIVITILYTLFQIFNLNLKIYN